MHYLFICMPQQLKRKHYDHRYSAKTVFGGGLKQESPQQKSVGGG